ncbi:TetR/AcrR family transcriptional regulator [Alloacidobacterium dinghuense]|uniref:TetR/AcrR family transcriptional regulator n=1 Tax=Alloacidobacterium dinghuense TaxID=2763107 RepID=A0A7G8BPE2_9BACT|nr:TetR/AcrR family transcriptional regulator [Alloacidobacterium dinghuense]QNI34412.1 TetR/AcrR family transcriptional regulator [Alloacidobacterium dinghuense]
MARKKEAACKRPYSLGKRLELSDQKRATVLAELRKQLEAKGFTGLTLDRLAQASGVTRQTIYNLFASKTGLLEALFDQIALEGGMERMRNVMMAANPELMLGGFVEIFSSFWSRDRILIRRVHGIAAIDPEFGAVVEARNQRRRFAAIRVIDMLDRQGRRDGADKHMDKEQRVATLHALTSFEFFDALSEGCGGVDQVARLLPRIIKNALSLES